MGAGRSIEIKIGGNVPGPRVKNRKIHVKLPTGKGKKRRKENGSDWEEAEEDVDDEEDEDPSALVTSHVLKSDVKIVPLFSNEIRKSRYGSQKKEGSTSTRRNRGGRGKAGLGKKL